jgi:hypothetical protein
MEQEERYRVLGIIEKLQNRLLENTHSGNLILYGHSRLHNIYQNQWRRLDEGVHFQRYGEGALFGISSTIGSCNFVDQC